MDGFKYFWMFPSEPIDSGPGFWMAYNPKHSTTNADLSPPNGPSLWAEEKWVGEGNGQNPCSPHSFLAV
jgi:hypothetical protein